MAKSIQDQIDALKEQLTKKAMISAAVRACNKAATSIRAEGAKRARETLNLKSSDIKDAVKIERAAKAEFLSAIKAVLSVDGKPIPLIKFSASPRNVRTAHGPRTGVSVKVKAERKLVTGGFIATVRGTTGIFRRGAKGEGYTSTLPRGPIRQLFSTSVADLFRTESFLSSLKEWGAQRVKELFKQELSFEVSKLKDKE